MTGAPVKDVCSLVNFIGNRAAAASGMSAGNAGSFGDVMSKASGSRQDLERPEQMKPDKGKNLHSSKVNASDSRRNVKEVKESEPVKDTEELTDEKTAALEEAGQKLVMEIAQKFSVSEEDVLKAMEELGLGMTSLLNADNLTMLALTLYGETDSLALLTNEGLYGTVQELLGSLEELQKGLTEQFSMTEEELQQLAESMENVRQPVKEPAEEQGKTAENALLQNQEENGKITVSVEESTKTVKLTTDEKGNLLQVEEAAPKESSENQAESDRGQQNAAADDRAGSEGAKTENPLLNALLQNKVPAQEVTFEQTQETVLMSRNANEIMDQILDYMKIQLKPGMDQLEMQLHPASLGTVRVQLVSESGEVTARFHVQNEAVKAAIEGQLMELKDNLKGQGIKIEAVEVTVESHAFESNLWQGRGREESSSYQEGRRPRRRINLNQPEEDFAENAGEEEILAAEMMEANGNTVDYTV